MINTNDIINLTDERRSSYFLLTKGEIYERANKFREDFGEIRTFNRKKAQDYGAVSFVESNYSYKVISLTFEGEKHPKFKLNKRKNGYIPAKKWAEDEEFSFFDKPYDKFQPWENFVSWLDAPVHINFQGGFCSIGNIPSPIHLSFFSKDSPILLETPDYEFYDTELKKIGHHGIDFRIETNHPVEKILSEKWNLMGAEYKESLKKVA